MEMERFFAKPLSCPQTRKPREKRLEQRLYSGTGVQLCLNENSNRGTKAAEGG